MVSRQTKVRNVSGLHARPASDFVIKAKTFASNITIQNLDSGGSAVSAKSILRLLAEGMTQGTQVEITAQGADEQLAVDSLIELIDSGFGE